MDTTNHIRILAVMELVLLIASLTASLSLESHLHPLLQEYLQIENEWDLSRIEDIILMLAIPIVVAHIVSVFGLMFIKNWAVSLFIITSIVLIIFGLFTGPVVDHAISSSLAGLAYMAEGIILYHLFFSKSAFMGKNN